MYYTAFSGHMEIVKQCKKLGGIGYDEVMISAAKNGYIEIMKLCREWGAREYDLAMLSAAKKGHIKIIKLCREWLGFEWIHDELHQYHHKLKFSRKIADELAPVAWHPDRWWDWCIDIEEKKEIQKL